MVNYIEQFKDRYLFHQCTNEDELNNQLNKESTYFYIGFDATSDALHVGSLVQLRAIKQLIKLGHKAIILLGGGTTKVGDPSGKDESRKILEYKTIEGNINNFKRIFNHYFRDHKESISFINNDDWLSELKYIELLRTVGSHVSINRMMGFESVKERLKREQSLSFLEFNYSLLQAFDFLKLNEEYDCKLQMGGSDQWGNIITGLELIRKKLSRQAFGLTSPLLTTSSGTKMGKSANGAIWLNEDQLSNWDFWQYWRNTEDNDVIKFLKLFTELSISEIIKLETLQGAEINDAKIILANHVTALCRGKEAAEQISITAKNTFNKLQNIEGIPNKNIANPTLSIVDALNILEFVSSNGEARRLIRGNGAKVNDILINDENFILSNNDYKDGKVKISSGKKKHGHLTLIN